MRINVVGLGYIGLPTALILASNGNKVVGTDNNMSLIQGLKAKEHSFQEQGLEELYERALKEGIQFSESCVQADMYIIAVPTPYEKENKKVNAKYVIRAVEDVLQVSTDDCIVVIESTVSPGTIDCYIRPLLNNDKRLHLVHAPERIIPGSMVNELVNNSRTIGADDVEIGQKVKQIYQSFCKGNIILTDIRTAEMTKVVENTYRDINIAFANELAKICRTAKLDVYEVIKIANMHPRVNILSPGPGVGGHCISVDPWFLVGDYPGLANIILAARKINDSMPEYVLERISEIMEKHGIKDVCRIGFYGLTYKEDVDDVRESPTLQLLDCMKKHLSYGVKTYDPYIQESVVPDQMFDFSEFIESVDIVVIMVGHKEIISNQSKLKGKIIFDTRNVIQDMEAYKL